MGAGGLLGDLTKRLYECALEGELTAHLGYEKHAPEGRDRGNSRNGKSTKRLKTETGELELEIPRDREGSFDPVLVPKGTDLASRYNVGFCCERTDRCRAMR